MLEMLEMLGVNHITDLCNILKVSSVNCSCDKLTIGSLESNTSLCTDKPHNLRMHKSSAGDDVSITVPLMVSVIAMIGMLGNSTAVWVQTRVVGVNTKHAALITLLALCDLSFAILMLIYYVPKIWTPQWLYGHVGCKGKRFIKISL